MKRPKSRYNHSRTGFSVQAEDVFSIVLLTTFFSQPPGLLLLVADEGAGADMLVPLLLLRLSLSDKDSMKLSRLGFIQYMPTAMKGSKRIKAHTIRIAVYATAVPANINKTP